MTNLLTRQLVLLHVKKVALKVRSLSVSVLCATQPGSLNDKPTGSSAGVTARQALNVCMKFVFMH